MPEYRAGLANSLLFLHIALRSFERNVDAEKAVRRSLAISEQLAAEFPNSPGYHSQWADASKRLGGLLISLGRLSESEKAYAQAAELEWNLAAEYGQGPSAGHYCFEYADTCAPLVSLVKGAGRPQEAAQICDRGIGLADKVAKAAPNEWQSLGHSYRLLSSTVLSLNRPSDAERCVRNALPMFEKLTAAYPTRAKDRNYLADTQRMLGDILQTEKQYEAAEEAYRAGLAIYAKTAVDLPRETPNRMDVAACRSGLANTFAARGRMIEAAEIFRQLAKETLHETVRPSKEAVQFAQRATELAPKDPKNWSLLASAQDRQSDWKAVEAAAKKAIELPEGGTSENEFLLAIAQWQLNNKSEARKWYDKAVAATAKAGADGGELNGLRAEMEKLLGQ